jgi:hypothetical protein
MDVVLLHMYATRECVYRVVALQWVYTSQYAVEGQLYYDYGADAENSTFKYHKLLLLRMVITYI